MIALFVLLLLVSLASDPVECDVKPRPLLDLPTCSAIVTGNVTPITAPISSGCIDGAMVVRECSYNTFFFFGKK